MKLIKDLGTFDAAHQLPTHEGKCRNLHGHTYRVVIEVDGELSTSGPSTGMVIDFGDLKDIWKEQIFSVVDHALLLGKIPLPWCRNLYPELVFDGQTRSEVLHVLGDTLVDYGFGKVAMLPILVTTAEYLAQWMSLVFYDVLVLRDDIDLTSVTLTVYETPTSSASYTLHFKGRPI